MKRFLALLLVLTVAVSWTSCTDENGEVRPFEYHNDDVAVADTLSESLDTGAHVVLLFGQSNADGVSHNSYLQTNDSAKFDEYSLGYDNVYINFYNDQGNNSSSGAFVLATLGCGCATETFGPEMGIAEVMHDAYPDEPIFIIKWTWGGTTLNDQWLDGKRNRGDLYNDAMDFTKKCLDYLIGKGYTDLTIDGICWMQGENDAVLKGGKNYEKDTASFVRLLRYDLSCYQETIRWIDAGINEEPGIWKNADKVNEAKKKVQKTDKENYYIDPTALELTSTNEPTDAIDYAHFDSLSMVKLGQAFGNICCQK